MTQITRRSFLAAVPFAPFGLRALAADAAANSLVYIGTYTEKSSKGIYLSHWDAVKGELSPFELDATTPDPTFMTVAPNHRALYCINEIENFHGGKDGAVSAFRITPATGALTALNSVDSGGPGPAHVTIDHTGKCVIAANYGGGSISSYQVKPDGSLSEMVSHFQYTGHGPNKDRQEAPHAHCSTVSPDNRFVLVNDLGLDRIHIYHLDAATAKLTPNTPPYYTAAPGSGPRHLTFHPNGRWVYAMNEMGSSIDFLLWDAAKGTLTHQSTVSLLPKGYTSTTVTNTGAEIAVDPTGRFVYASNRGIGMMLVFGIDRGRGSLNFIQRISSGGSMPRFFTLDPSGKWLLVGDQTGDMIAIFKRDPVKGTLTRTDKTYKLGSPVCIVFA
ncbi:MAG: lactonase family protein [Acidobacteriaceae bacterium]